MIFMTQANCFFKLKKKFSKIIQPSLAIQSLLYEILSGQNSVQIVFRVPIALLHFTLEDD